MVLQEGSGPGLAEAGAPSFRRDEDRFALTSPQMAIWLDQALHPHKPIYNTGQTLAIGAALDIGRFAAALRIVIAENDALRLRFSQRGSAIFQEIIESVDDGLEVKDFTSECDPETAAVAWIERNFWAPLTPADFPLFRFAVAKLGERRFLWLQKYHHLIIDATGRQLVAARVAAVYNALSQGERPAATSGGSYRIAKESEDKYLASDQYAVDKSYWLSRFGELPESLVRTDAKLSEKTRSGRPARLHYTLTDRDWTRLRTFARAHASSPFKIICCLVWSCFSRLYANRDLAFGVALANRSAAEKNTVGLFSKVIPFRPRLDPDMPFSAALATLDGDLATDLKHQRFPTDHINGALLLRRFGRERLFDFAVNYVRNDYGFDFGGAPVACSNLSAGFALPWSIMALEYGSEPVCIVIDYDCGRIPHEMATRVRHGLQELLIAAPDAGDIAIGRLPMTCEPMLSAAAGGSAPAPAWSMERPVSHADDLSRTVVQIWREIFGDSMNEGANFFDLGGDSLKAVFVVGECNARFGIDLPLTVLFERPTIGGLVDAVRSAADHTAQSRLALLKPGGSEKPLLLIHPVGGTLFCYGDLVSRLPANTPVYGMQAAGLGIDEALPDSVEDMASDYLRAASARLGHGPWHLAGWSFGGLVAFEMALQLVELGWPVASLTLIDTPAQPLFQAGEEEESVLAAVAGALGINLASIMASGVAPTIPALVSAVAARLGAPAVSEDQVERMAALVRNLRRLRRNYRPRSFGGPMLLVRAASDPVVGEDAFDWNQYAPGRVNAVAIPATHHSIVFPPHVDDVAAILGSVLAAGENDP